MNPQADILEAAGPAAAAQQGAAIQAVRRIAADSGEPDWLLARRVKALEFYQCAPLPSRAGHLWRYTDPAEFVVDPARADLNGGGRTQIEAGARRDLEHEDLSGRAVVHNGALLEVQLDPELSERGALIMDLHRAARECPDELQQRLGAVVPGEHGKFEALNMALWRAGLYVTVPEGMIVPKPIHLVFSGGAEAGFIAPRLLVAAGPSSEINLVLELIGPHEAAFDANVVVEAIAAQNARVRLVTISRWGEGVKSYCTQRTAVERDAVLETVWAGLGGRVTKCDIGAKMLGPGARAVMWGLTFAQGRQHFDVHTEHWHAAQRTTSDMDFKVVLKDKARSVYTGLIRIDRHSTGCEAYQENRNLLLNEGPQTQTIPELEILNEDVKCTHGATVGPIDQDELFYLQARGIPRDEAMRIIVAGFVHHTLEHIPDQIKDRLESYVAERLREI
ncbi:MAG: Fe-S cluster assembly protein SufD [Candidatus Sumerlaeia bacterium]